MVTLAKEKVGLIIPSFMYSMPNGCVFPDQNGFCTDLQAGAWESTVKSVHAHGAKIIFQIAHAGAASDPSVNDGPTLGPSGFLPRSRAMTIAEIDAFIQSYIDAAKRLVKIGVDGINIHCAHGYGLGQFLSPYSNRRTDQYGQRRTRIVEEIVSAVKKVVPEDFAIVSKINGHDCISEGVTPQICADNVRILSASGIQMFEISTGFLNAMTMSRADFKEGRVFRNAKTEQIEYWKAVQKNFNPEFPYSQGYTVRYAEVIRKVNPNVPLAIVGGLRNFDQMEKLVKEGKCDLVSMSRPFIRDPHLVRRFLDGEIDEVECKSCNQCFCRPVKCHFPSE
jgi:2,4-dienoyl-CoA reductase-like NADH-dependent reductase (Old Yellow Enzyme family)